MVTEFNNNYLIDIDEACEYLHCGKATIYNLLRSGELNGFRINRRWKIPKEAIEELIRNQLSDNTLKPKKKPATTKMNPFIEYKRVSRGAY